MIEQRKFKEKNVKYRTRHKSLDHLTSDDTKHGFKKRLQGALQRQEAEPVYFGVSDFTLSTQDSMTDTFQPLDQNNYQEAANWKQRRSRARSASSKSNRLRGGSQSSLRRHRLNHDGSRTPVVPECEGDGLLRGHPPQVLDDCTVTMEPRQSGQDTSPFLPPPNPLQYLPAHFTFPAPSHTSRSTNFTGVVVGPSMGHMGGVGINGLGRSSFYSDDQTSNQTVAGLGVAPDLDLPRGGYSMPFCNVDSPPIYYLPTEQYTSSQQDWSAEG